MSLEMCQFCGKPATVHMTQIINNDMTVVHMCAECAAKRGLLDQEGLPFAMLSSLGEALFAGIKQQLPVNGLICSECGCTPMSFKETGRLGCPNCYKDLRLLIDAIIESSQKGTIHTGKRIERPAQPVAGKVPAKNNIKPSAKKKRAGGTLQEQLEKAVKEERYEDAAKIRDKIKKPKKKRATKKGKDE